MEDDWQNVPRSKKNRNVFLVKTGYGADCRFDVGEETFQAHKILLASMSPVFDRMFYGSPAVSGEESIVIDDMEAPVFRDLLKFIYTDNVRIRSVERALPLYEAAKKYMLIQLKWKCINCLKKNINGTNVWELLELSKRNKENVLKESCLKFIRNETPDILHQLNAKSFYVADPAFLETILSQNKLEIIDELELFNALQYYTAFHYPDYVPIISEHIEKEESSHLEQSIASEKPILSPSDAKPIIPFNDIKELTKKHIRFMTMTALEFADGPALTGLLDTDDALAILACLVDRDQMENNFPNGFCDTTTKRAVRIKNKLIDKCEHCLQNLECFNCKCQQYLGDEIRY